MIYSADITETENLEKKVEYYRDKYFQMEQLFEAQRDTIDKYHKIFMLQEAELKQLRGDTE